MSSCSDSTRRTSGAGRPPHSVSTAHVVRQAWSSSDGGAAGVAAPGGRNRSACPGGRPVSAASCSSSRPAPAETTSAPATGSGSIRVCASAASTNGPGTIPPSAMPGARTRIGPSGTVSANRLRVGKASTVTSAP